MLEKYKEIAKRNILWIVIGIAASVLLCPGLGEIKTLLLIVIAETIAVALSGFAQYVYTRIDFTRDAAAGSLGVLFLGVHILVGLTILGVYIAQFAG